MVKIFSVLLPGTYLGSNPNFHQQRTPASSNNKKRPISPEQVLRLFGTGSNTQAGGKLNVVDRPRRSPASSPPSTTHQSNYGPRPAPYGPSLHELSTRTITMVREPGDGTHGFGICVKGGKDAGKHSKHTLLYYLSIFVCCKSNFWQAWGKIEASQKRLPLRKYCLSEKTASEKTIP